MESNKNLGQLFKEFIYSDFLDAVIGQRLKDSIDAAYTNLDSIVKVLKSGHAEQRHYEEFEETLDDIDALETVYVYYSGDYGYQSRLEEYENLGGVL